jgi:Uncharacterized vancomycin resistance protein
MKKGIAHMITALSLLFLVISISALVYAREVDEVAESTAVNKTENDNPIESTGRILDGVYIDSVNVSNMTREEAIAAVDKYLDEIKEYKIQMHVGNKTATATAGELGLSWDGEVLLDKVMSIGKSGDLVSRFKVQEDLKQGAIRLVLPYEADRAQIEQIIKERCVPFDCEAVNATIRTEGGEFVIEKEQSGIRVDEEQSVDIVEEYLSKLWRAGGGSVELAAEIKQAAHTAIGLSEITDVLGKASTDYSASSANRAKNIRNGTAKVSGAVVFPGEEYSVCDAMVPFTEANGYELGASYADGEVVESFGGGICQVSTTLYLALLRSELEILERHEHSMTVKYVKLSMDAAIAEGSKDLVFRNNLDSPIYIEGYANGGDIGFVVYGKEYRPEGRTVSYESETIETIEPTVNLVAAGDFGRIEQISQSQTGYKASLWKVVTENGEETKTKVNDSRYQMQPTKYEVGVSGATGAAAEAIYSAIEKNDLDAAFSAVYKYR